MANISEGIGWETWLRLTHELDHLTYNRLTEGERRSIRAEYDAYFRTWSDVAKLRHT